MYKFVHHEFFLGTLLRGFSDTLTIKQGLDLLGEGSVFLSLAFKRCFMCKFPA